MNYIGIDLGGTNIKGALVSAEGEILKEHSIGTKFLPNHVSVNGSSLSDYVYVNVLCRNLSTIQYEKNQSPIPNRKQRQRINVVHRRIGILRFTSCLRSKFYSP